MIVRKHLNWKIILQSTWRPMAIVTTVATAVTMGYVTFGFKELSISGMLIGVMGTALAILLGFRNNSAYDRWWEARRLWGGLVNDSRSLARQILSFATLKHAKLDDDRSLRDFHREMIHRQIAFAHALRLHLRRQSQWNELAPFLSPEEFERTTRAQHIPLRLLQTQADRLTDALELGYIEDFRHMQLDSRLSSLCDLLGGCERIKNTPFPRQYDYFTHLFVWIFCLILPFSMVKDFGYLTILASTVICFIFYVLDRVGRNNEDPFENKIQDTPMSALCRTIEINLMELLGESELPKPLEAVNGYLY